MIPSKLLFFTHTKILAHTYKMARSETEALTVKVYMYANYELLSVVFKLLYYNMCLGLKNNFCVCKLVFMCVPRLVSSFAVLIRVTPQRSRSKCLSLAHVRVY